MNKSFKQFIRENEHIHYYTEMGVGYALNKKLKAGEPLTDKEKHHHEGLSRHIKENRIQHNMTVYRGQADHPGKGFTSKGYLSTSDDEGSAEAYAQTSKYAFGQGSHMLHISVKKGQAISNIDEHSQYAGEGEHLIHHGAKVKITHTGHTEDDITHHYGHLEHDGT